MKRYGILISVMLVVLIGMVAQLPAAERTITVYTNAGDISGDSSGPSPITFQNNKADFPAPVVGQNINKTGAITIDTTNKTVGLGGGLNDTFGSLWYQGNSDIAYCVNGACDFGGGLRAYYDFVFTTADSSSDSTSSGDGFTFAVISAINNDVTRTGGSPAGTSLGELMGYAGPGTTTDSQGLRPPKMAVEFDVYPNTGGDHSTNMCTAGTRMDPTISGGFKNHIALVYWGMTSVAGQCGPFNGIMYNRDTFDDNQHGAGAAGEVPPTPMNSPNIVSSTNTDYYEGPRNGSYNWMEDGQLHRFRVEITRPIMPNASTGNFDYTVKAWVDCAGACTLANFQNVNNSYSDTTPQIWKTVSLDPSYHNQFRRILIGFTEATGGATQVVKISNFQLYFPQSSCTYAITPTSASYPSAGGLGNISITAGAGCNWNSVSNSTWLHVTPSGTGTGSGSMSYTVDANTGSARAGTMTIAGQPLTVTQSTGCTYAISPTGASYVAAGGTGTVTVTAGTGCAWTAVSNNAWITVTSGATGTSSGTVGYTVAANAGVARTGTITIASQTFTVSQNAGAPTCSLTPSPIIVANNSATSLAWTIANGPANGAWSVSPGGTCANFSSSSGGSCTTANQTTAGTRTYTLTVSNANGSSSCSATFYVGCAGYRVWNNTGSTWDFKVTGQSCHTSVSSGSEITTSGNSATWLQPGETVSRYTTAGGGCSSAVQGSITYTGAMNADIVANGGNGLCTVNYNSGDVPGDH